jgi:hypothetical protein
MQTDKDASEIFEQFMCHITKAYNVLAPALEADPDMRGTMMAAACDVAEIVLAVWQADAGIQYLLIKRADYLYECVNTQLPVGVEFAVVPVLDVDDAWAAKEAYDIISAAPEVAQ